jgi:hypothetical protein
MSTPANPPPPAKPQPNPPPPTSPPTNPPTQTDPPTATHQTGAPDTTAPTEDVLTKPLRDLPPSSGTQDIEKQNPPDSTDSPPGHKTKTTFFGRLFDAFLLPFNMFAPLPDYHLAKRISSHHDERISDSLYKILIGAETLRTKQWRIAYWVVNVSLICTLGTAFIGIATAILSFNNHHTASKGLSILLAGFGVILSLLKGTGQPANAFANINRANDIIDAIEDFDTTSDTIDTKRLDAIKGVWRQVRDHSFSEEASIWKNIQK